MNEPIRVLHCVVNMNRGGAETLIMNIYRNIDRSKVQFDFLTSMEGVFDNEIRSLGGKVYRIPYITKSGPFKYSKDIHSFLEKHSYKIIHSHMDRMSGIMMREAKKAGVQIRIAHSHSTKNEGNLIEKSIKKYYGLYLNCATKYMSCSKEAGKALFGNKKKVQVLHNGIETDKFIFNKKIREKMREEFGVNGEFIIGHIGRFDKPKNQDFLIALFNEIGIKNKKLILVGDGELKDKLQKKVNDMGIENRVIFTGIRDDVNELLQAFDLFVFPSIFEGLPVTVIEAQAAGLKCILSDTITKEVDITGNVDFVSLNKSSKEWAYEVLKYKDGYARGSTNELILKAGYDIKDTAKQLEEFYLNEYCE